MKALPPLLLLGLLAVGPAYADCTYPTAPDKLPDGATASRADMVAAQKQMQAYNDEIKKYQDCLQAEYDAAVQKAGDSLKKEQKDSMYQIMVKKSNDAQDQVEKLTQRFNEQIRAYNNKGKS
jgi:glutamate-1-semialdehyde aminotransferase